MSSKQANGSGAEQNTNTPNRRPEPKQTIQTKLEYRDGLPLLSPQSPTTTVVRRDCTPGRCLRCALAGARCEFAEQKIRPSGRCARCGRAGADCLVRRPRGGDGEAGPVTGGDGEAGPVTGGDPRDWVAADSGVSDEEAAGLAWEMRNRAREGRMRDVCGLLVAEGDARGWACPSPGREGFEADGEDVFWMRVLPRRLGVKAAGGCFEDGELDSS